MKQIFLLAFLLIFPLRVLYAQTQYPVIGGIQVHCTDATGYPVYTAYMGGFNDWARSLIATPGPGMGTPPFTPGLRLIILNSSVFTTIPPLMQLFTYAHECGHHISGDIVAATFFQHNDIARELNADRIGIRLLRDQLNITLQQAQAIASVFANNPPMWPYYPPGPQRAQWIMDCYRTQDAACGHGAGGSNSP